MSIAFLTRGWAGAGGADNDHQALARRGRRVPVTLNEPPIGRGSTLAAMRILVLLSVVKVHCERAGRSSVDAHHRTTTVEVVRYACSA